jgi:hypothetical protein
VRESVTALIEHASTPRFPSSVTFVGWKDCATDPRDVRIEVRDVRPITDVGRQWARDESKSDRPKLLDKRNMPIPIPTRMVLNFTFQREFRACATQVHHCIRATAVHEFLHAIGFLHEQLRDDGGDCFTQFQHHPDSRGYMPIKIGGFDPDSHMNYCIRRMNGAEVSNIYRKPMRLSDGDKEVLSWFYPPR